MSQPSPVGTDREPEGTGKTSRAVHRQRKKERLGWGASPNCRRETCHGMQERWEGQLQQFLKSLQPILAGRGSSGTSEASPWEDTKEFLASFEQVAKACRWPRDQWAAHLLPALSGEAEEAFRGLEARDQENYEKVKAAILRGEALRTERQRQHFRQFCCQEMEDPRRIHSQLQELCRQWLRPERRTKEQILELLILEQFLASLPPELRSWIQARRPESCPQAVALVEDFLMSQQEAKSRTPQGPLKEEPVDFPVAENEPPNASAEPDVDAKLLVNGFQPPDLSPLPSPREEVDQTDGKEGSRELMDTGGPLQIVQQGVTQPGQRTMLWQVLQEAGNPTDRDASDKMSAKRNSYSVEFKKGIVEDSRGKNLTAFCKERKLAVRMVRKWRAEYENLSQQVDEGNAKKRKCGSGRQPLFPELEDNVCEWIADRRAKALVVRRADIQAFALAMASQLEISPEFKASQHWLDYFLQRYELSLRRSTAPFKLEDGELLKRALAFKSYVDGLDFSQYQLSNMIAMDETAVFVGPGSETTMDQRGASSICVPSPGYESARVTCILAIRLDGTKAPPLIVTKGARDKLECISDIYVLETEKAWCTQAVIRTWVDLMLPLVLRGGQRGLLVWDSASTHRAKDMKKFLAERGIDQITIPAGMTAYLQTLDIAISKPFKDHLHREINDYMENRTERDQGGNLAKPGLPEVVTWVKNSWDKITGSRVADALRAGYVDKKGSFKESSVAGHERLGPMVLEETESRETQTRIRGGLESYDDIAEEDDMTVFE